MFIEGKREKAEAMATESGGVCRDSLLNCNIFHRSNEVSWYLRIEEEELLED